MDEALLKEIVEEYAVMSPRTQALHRYAMQAAQADWLRKAAEEMGAIKRHLNLFYAIWFIITIGGIIEGFLGL